MSDEFGAMPIKEKKMQWQPIETAPRDGTVVLICKYGEVAAGWWAPHQQYGWSFVDHPQLTHDEECDYVIPNAWAIENGPTHWAPLPEPPKAGTSQQPLGKLAARLAELLDEDQWAECEALLVAAGVTPNVGGNGPA